MSGAWGRYAVTKLSNARETFLCCSENIHAPLSTSKCRSDTDQWSKLLVLLNVDNTLAISDNPVEIQYTPNQFVDYCVEWKLKVRYINLPKNKVIIFGARKVDTFNFKLYIDNLEITNSYKYLGLYFTSNWSFATTRKHLAEQTKNSMHLLYTRIYNLDIPIDLQIKFFDQNIVPILTYNCENCI